MHKTAERAYGIRSNNNDGRLSISNQRYSISMLDVIGR